MLYRSVDLSASFGGDHVPQALDQIRQARSGGFDAYSTSSDSPQQLIDDVLELQPRYGE